MIVVNKNDRITLTPKRTRTEGSRPFWGGFVLFLNLLVKTRIFVYNYLTSDL
jgi:hypothetical protein